VLAVLIPRLVTASCVDTQAGQCVDTQAGLCVDTQAGHC